MKNIIFLCCCLFSMPTYGDWLPNPGETITTNTSNDGVFTACDSTTGQILAVWSDAITDHPSYSFWNGSSWGPANSISSSLTVKGSTFTSCDPTTGFFLTVWADNITSYPYYSFWNGSSWSPAATIETVPHSQAFATVFPTYNSQTGQFLAMWTDTHNNNYPTYTFWNGSSWSPLNAISSPAASDVYVTCDSTTGYFLALWPDSGTHPTSSLWTGSSWGPVTTISSGSRVSDAVYPVCDSTTGQFLAVWADSNNNFYPTYSFGNGSSWSSISTISSSSEVSDNVYGACDPITGQFLVTWEDGNIFYPTYSLWSGSSWSPIGTIGPIDAFNVFVSYYPTTEQFIGTWVSSPAGNPIYSFYTPPPLPPPTPPAPQAPTNLAGVVKKNRFLTQTELFNVITWSPPASGVAAVSYKIYRDAALTDLIDTVPASGNLIFVDHNRHTNRVYTYYIVAISETGAVSIPSSVEVFTF